MIVSERSDVGLKQIELKNNDCFGAILNGNTGFVGFETENGATTPVIPEMVNVSVPLFDILKPGAPP